MQLPILIAQKLISCKWVKKIPTAPLIYICCCVQLIMTKSEILEKIEGCFDVEKDRKARNSMGVSESFYNAYYLVGMCFTDDKKIKVADSELSKMTETELNNLIKLAEYAADAFY